MRLADFVKLQRGFDLPEPTRRPGGVPVYGSFGITGWHDEARASGPGVTVGRSGASMGVVAYAPVDYWPLNTALFVTDFCGNDPRFAYYLLGQTSFAGHNSGSAQPSLNRNLIGNITLRVPPVTEQRAIGRLLGALDDKIELNRRMSKTLEDIAEALFAKLCGTTPSDPRPLRTFVEEFRLTMGQSPPGDTYNTLREGSAFYQGRADFGSRFPTPRVYCTAPTRFAEAGDTLVSVRAPVGSVNLALEHCAIGRGVAAVRHRSGSRSYTYYALRALHEQFARFDGEGTVFGSISKADFERIPVRSMTDEAVLQFDDAVAPLDNRIELMAREARTLTELRDTLLPRLLSGALRLRDAEREVALAT